MGDDYPEWRERLYVFANGHDAATIKAWMARQPLEEREEWAYLMYCVTPDTLDHKRLIDWIEENGGKREWEKSIITSCHKNMGNTVVMEMAYPKRG